MALAALHLLFGCPLALPPPCSPAEDCLILTRRKATNCHPGPDNDDTPLDWTLKSTSLRDAGIWAVLNVGTEFINQGAMPSVYGTRLTFVPEAIELDLDCEYEVAGDHQWNQQIYSIDEACFADDTSCRPPSVPPPRVTDCAVTCSAPECVEVQLPVAAERIVRDTVLEFMAAKSVDLNKLLGLNAVCAERELLRAADGPFTSVGSTCDLHLKLPGGSEADSIIITMDSVLSGAIVTLSAASRVLSFDEEERPYTQWFDKAEISMGREGVDRVLLTDQTVKVIGSERYCIWIQLHSG